MISGTIHCKLLAKKEGIYTIYVFQQDDNSYIMCTQLPHWGIYNINIGDSGFLTYEEVQAGESYFDRDTQTQKVYQFSNTYFKDFIKDQEKTKEIIL